MSQSQAATPARLGGVPTVAVDVPATAVFLAIYVAFAATNMTILQLNLKRGHKFLVNGALFGFCMARIATCVMRIAWATHRTNSGLATTASILINAGILIIYVVNLIFAQRILRAKQPRLGWNPVLRAGFKALYVLIALALAGVISSVVILSSTHSAHTRAVCRDVQLAALTYLFIFTLVPWLLLAAAYLLPTPAQVDFFGQGSINRKALVVSISTALCVTICGFKIGTAWMPPRLASHPAWFDSKACFYIFNFGLEIVILTLLVSTRVDKLFHVPDGSTGPGDYTTKRLSSSHSSENGDREEVKL